MAIMSLSPEAVAALSQIDLKEQVESPRRARLARLEAYGAGTQYDRCRYNWDGMMEYGDVSIPPGFYIPHKHRRPSWRVSMTQTCVGKLTELAIAEDRFPEICVPGDEEAESYVRALAETSRAIQRLIVARGCGGVAGAVMLSYAFVEGVPCIEIHKTFELLVLKWGDMRLGKTPKSVLRIRQIQKQVGKVTKDFWALRWWSEVEEAVAEVPCEGYDPKTWMLTTSWTTVQHQLGVCPCVWIQNMEDDDPDGKPDLTDESRENSENLDRLLSASNKGTIANVDPTLVVKMDPAVNPGTLRKGSDNALFSPQGAEYLELSGTAVEAAATQARGIAKSILDQAGVVLPDQERLTANASSGEALKLLYKPMTSRCDRLRGQYGAQGLQPLLTAMLRAAKRLGPKAVVLPPDLSTERDERGQVVSVTEKEVTPGKSERVVINWPPYFLPTMADAAALVGVALKAKNNLISTKTAIRAVQALGVFPIADPEQEYIDILLGRELEMANGEGDPDGEDADSGAEDDSGGAKASGGDSGGGGDA